MAKFPSVAAVLGASLAITPYHASAFAPSRPSAQVLAPPRTRAGAGRYSHTQLFSSDDSNNNDESTSLSEQARKAVLEAEKMEAELTLAKIDKLEGTVKKSTGHNDKERSGLREEIEALAKKIDPALIVAESSSSSPTTTPATITATVSSPPAGLSAEQLEAACIYFMNLPITMRSALASAVGYDEQASLSGLEVNDVVSKLYERRETLSTTRLRENYKETLQAPLTLEQGVGEMMDELKNMLENPDAMRLESAVDTQIPKQARQEGKCPTEADVNTFFRNICGKKTYLAAEKPIRAGEVWVIRGRSQKNDAASLIEAIDKALEEKAPDWSERNQYCYIMDPSLEEGEDDIFGDPVILITNKDMAPMVPSTLTIGSSVTALVGSFLFCLGTYGSNKLITDRLQEANNVANYDFSWFNELLIPLIGAFFAIQASHELGHLFIAWRDKMKVTPPTILPSLGLPYVGTLTRMKTAPKDYNTLFDFAFAGPVTGMGVAFAFLVWGLQLTVTMDQEAAKYLPSVPVGFLKLSSLGGTLVDQIVGGGAGIMLQEDPTTMISLHPFAIAGFTGMIINALDLIPIGSTDGARLSQAVLGRVGQTVVGGFAYIILLGALVFLDQRDVFLSYCLVNSIVQRDLEVPCKNEVDRAGVGRAAAAIAAYFVAALVLVPL